jgi:hypothetical protein
VFWKLLWPHNGDGGSHSLGRMTKAAFTDWDSHCLRERRTHRDAGLLVSWSDKSDSPEFIPARITSDANLTLSPATSRLGGIWVAGSLVLQNRCWTLSLPCQRW